jgi:hypothetical protein
MNRNTRMLLVLVAAAAASASGCTGGIEEDDNTLPPGSTIGGEDNTFDHDNSGVDPFELLDRLQQEGPPKYSARVHGCTKPRYATIGNILASRGVDVASTANLSAGQLYRSGYNALGGANYAARIRENIDVTTSGASRLFDIFVQAAPEIIANLPSRPECQIGGVGVTLFNGDTCSAEGVTCLLGFPATAQHIELCNFAITQAADPDTGKRIAVASLMAAAHTCE